MQTLSVVLIGYTAGSIVQILIFMSLFPHFSIDMNGLARMLAFTLIAVAVRTAYLRKYTIPRLADLQ